MKTYHPIIALSLFATTLTACSQTEPVETKVIERATTVTPSLTARTTKAPRAVVPETIALPLEEPAAPDETFEPEITQVDGLSLVRFVTASGIENREPVLPSSSFALTEERVYAFVEAKNESDAPKLLKVYFIGPDDEVGGGVELEIPASSPRWRTWAYTRYARSPGLWRVEIRDDVGTLVGALPFEVDSP